jgi:NAD(P)-dependent dehydrogenase (short-subunit alcohol dehydrogenase family)
VTPKAKLHAAAFDLATGDGCAALTAQVAEVDILVNNLGIYEPALCQAGRGRQPDPLSLLEGFQRHQRRRAPGRRRHRDESGHHGGGR